MNIKHLFFYMLLIAFSSCSKPGYEKAIAEWVQTDFHGTWTDLKFELLYSTFLPDWNRQEA